MTTKNSTKPPGATSYKDTAFGIISRNKLLPLELKGTRKGLDFVYKLLESSECVEITPQLICEVHEVSFKWIFPEWAGKFRTVQVTYSTKEAPSYFQIPELVKNLCDDLKVQIEDLPLLNDGEYIGKVVSLLAWFQHRFVLIHPFKDYNGRTARMLTILLLLNLNLPAVELQIKNEADRKEYLTAMHQGDDGDLSLLEDIIERALIEGLEV